MKIVDVTTQAELDAAVAAGNAPCVRSGSYKVSVGRVWAEGDAIVEAHGSAKVYARESAMVKAFGGSWVEAHDNATVGADDHATVIASGESKVYAHYHAIVLAQDNVTVEADTSATVKTCDDAEVTWAFFAPDGPLP